jgi:hypothetical protein
MKPGQFMFELHTNYVAEGTTQPDGLVAPTNDQFHMASEFTLGITRDISLGTMLLNARRVGSSFEYAGWKILPNVAAPRDWKLPFDLAVVGEISFVKSAYEKDGNHFEIHPVIEKRLQRFQVDLNPSIGEGWVFRPSAKAQYLISRWFIPSVEFYSQSKEFHHVLSGAKIEIGKGVSWHIGVGKGPTATGSRLLYMSRLEFRSGGS